MKPSQKEGRRRFPIYFAIGFSLFFGFLYWLDVFVGPERVWMDRVFLLRAASLKPGDPRIIIAAIDDQTIKKHGLPPPRSLHARFLDKAKAYGVKTVAFDMMFLEPREHDAELIEATRRFGKAIHIFKTETKYTPAGEVVQMDLPIEGLIKASEYAGYPNVDQLLDGDGHLRRAMMFDRRVQDPKDKNRMGPSLDAAILASFLGKPLEQIAADFGGDKQKVLIVNYRPPRKWLKRERRDAGLVGKVANLDEIDSAYRTISYMDLLSGELSEAQKKAIKGSIMLVGSTTLGYYDHYPTPFLQVSPGVDYHANVIDNALHGDFLLAWPRGRMLLVMLAMIWIPVWLVRLPPLIGAGGAAALFVSWTVFGFWQASGLVQVEFIAPLTALGLSFLVQTVYRVLTEGQEKRAIQQTFGRFVSPEVVKDLAKNPEKATISSQERDMTVFFLDIAHFTNISEKIGNNIFDFLNVYLSALTEVIEQEHKGTVDKYIGDCVMAFWNAPLDQPDHRLRACLAAIRCQEVMKRINETHKFPFPLPELPEARIGLNSGLMKVGFTGSQQKLQYTVIGDEVNLASRLEGANKFFGSRIMVSESTFEGARSAVDARELGRIRVIGKETPIRVFELLAKKDELSETWKKALPHYERGLKHFQKREFAESVMELQEVAKLIPDDGPANFYLTEARGYAAIAPAEEWDGVVKMTAK
ncbi:MAG: adenylate/guanylate cyclase domain-containing protein [Elusimicrobia bacterium]|nr:adenylate/guanylate cyclase domain-containing protein [Elusimicrobiota bacterium]